MSFIYNYKFISPISVNLGVKKIRRYLLNLNTYRNQNRFLENNIKDEYCKVMGSQLAGIILDKPNILYKIYYGSRHKHDKGNFLSIIQKYFLDALVFHGCIVDDCDGYIGEEIMRYGGIDKENPRVEIYIY